MLVVPPTGQPNPYECEPFKNEKISGVSCVTDATGMTKVDFTTTMQPGDNFAVVAGTEEAYVSGLTLADDGINLEDTEDIQIPVTTTELNACSTTALRACRADMLTVWRRLHLEVDSMGTVDSFNNVTGTVSAVRQGTNPNCNPPPPPAPPPNPPCYPTFTIYDVTTTSGTPLEIQRFDNGRIVVGLEQYNVLANDGASIGLKTNSSLSRKNKVGKAFTIYDDDDYNDDDNLVDGDLLEQIVPLPESFKYLTPEDGNHPDGKPKNVYASAYIMPEYGWAQNVANYNQTNLAFDLNVSADQTNSDELFFALTTNRGSRNDEKDDFWIAYFLLGYQGNETEDADGDGANPGISKRMIGTVSNCDCYQSTNCPAVTPPPVACSTLPTGSFGSLLYEEVQQDVHRTWLLVGTTFQNIETTAPHELGHQFGFSGDQFRTTFKIMDLRGSNKTGQKTLYNGRV